MHMHVSGYYNPLASLLHPPPYRRLSAPPLEAVIAMREATEVRIGDNLQYIQPLATAAITFIYT